MTNAELGDMVRRMARAAITSDADYDKLVAHYETIDRDPAMIPYDLEDGIRLVFGLEVR